MNKVLIVSKKTKLNKLVELLILDSTCVHQLSIYFLLSKKEGRWRGDYKHNFKLETRKYTLFL